MDSEHYDRLSAIIDKVGAVEPLYCIAEYIPKDKMEEFLNDFESEYAMTKSFNSMVERQRNKTIVKSELPDYYFKWLTGIRGDRIGILADLELDYLHRNDGQGGEMGMYDYALTRGRELGLQVYMEDTFEARDYLFDTGMIYETGERYFKVI